MTANGFVGWFLGNIPDKVIIPYKPSNQYNKLIKLAEKNNRELKKNHPRMQKGILAFCAG